MTDFLRQFRPWQDGFTKGLYLAGVESNAESVAPEGWTKWEVPSFEYVKIKCEDEMTFQNGIQYLSENGLDLAGAVHDFTDPVSGNNYMLFPIKKL